MTTDDTDRAAYPRLMSWGETLALGIAFLVLAAVMAYFLVALWPEKVVGGGKGWDNAASLFGVPFTVRFETRLLLLVMVAGALGSYVHGATSFATFVGNRTLLTSWVWWYVLRTPIGVALALLFYFALRGGLLSAGSAGDVLSPFGVAAVAGLVGLFSKQATDKLRELFDTLFRTAPGKGDDERKDKAEKRPAPVLRGVEPRAIASGGGDVSLKVTGENFNETSVVQVNGNARPTNFISATELVVHLNKGDLAAPGLLHVSVVTPPPGGGASSALNVTVT